MKLRRMLAAALLLAFTSATYALPNPVVAEVRDDGSLVIEGVRYTDVVPLSTALKKLRQRHVTLHIHGHPDIRFEAVGKAILLLQKAGCAAGCMKVGFITVQPPAH